MDNLELFAISQTIGGGGSGERAVVYAGGHDSILQKVTSMPGETIVRTNEINDNTSFGTVFGERNHLGYTTDDNWSTYTVDSTYSSNGTAVAGGANVISQTEDGFVFGYKNRTYAAHQSIIGGYKSKVYASESAVFGERHTINGTLYEDSGDLKTTTKRLLVYGSENTVDVNTQDSFIGGYQNNIGTYLQYSCVNGKGNTVGNHCGWINVFGGGSNIIHNNIDDTTVFGYENELYGGPNTSSKRSLNFVFGAGNVVQNHNDTDKGWNKVIVAGFNLRPRHSSHIVLGWYNAHDASEDKDVLTIGCGKKEDDTEYRDNCFGTGKDSSNNKYIRIGDTVLTETQLIQLLATI